MLIADNRVRASELLFKTEASAFGESHLFKIDRSFILNHHLAWFWMALMQINVTACRSYYQTHI